LVGKPVPFVKVVHGSVFPVTKIKIDGPCGRARLDVETRRILDTLRLQIESARAPQMVLNAQCPACEYREQCRAAAIERDDPSLLRA